ncbi:Uncharacterized protein dnm_071700 [Desulfonema magnum]|uniref:Uncharacterized protein n=1 Tax=Desulfonema magnum TaxID=45655 RepID=A0A975BTZ6_9BACT|nr:Uncharacterized protein dnm_071700 [Desulfonema magnum]
MQPPRQALQHICSKSCCEYAALTGLGRPGMMNATNMPPPRGVPGLP